GPRGVTPCKGPDKVRSSAAGGWPQGRALSVGGSGRGREAGNRVASRSRVGVAGQSTIVTAALRWPTIHGLAGNAGRAVWTRSGFKFGFDDFKEGHFVKRLPNAGSLQVGHLANVCLPPGEPVAEDVGQLVWLPARHRLRLGRRQPGVEYPVVQDRFVEAGQIA